MKIGIIGLGLIGGSLAAALKKKGYEVWGYDIQKKVYKLALKKKLIDSEMKYLWYINELDILVLATGPFDILLYAKKIKKALRKEDLIITDTASVKLQIVKEYHKRKLNFVGAHPLAGREKGSIENADPNLFKGKICVITKTKLTNNKAFLAVKKMWEDVGAKVVSTTPLQHDKYLSYFSHLPQALAYILWRIGKENGFLKKYKDFVTPSFVEMTRISQSPPSLWQEIFTMNKKYLIKMIQEFSNKLFSLKEAAESKKEGVLASFLKKCAKKS